MSDEGLTESPIEIVAKTYSVAVKGEGLTLERQVGESAALAILQIVMGGAPASSPIMAPHSTPNPGASPPVQQSSSLGERRISLRNYLDEVGAKNNSAKIVAIGAYLREVEGRTEFSREDIAEGFRSARDIPPGNLPRDVITTVRLGWIAEDTRNKNHFYVTAVGDEALSSGFEGARASSSRKKRGKKTKGSNQQASGDEE